MTRSRTTYRASAMDMLRSDSRIVCGLGPADFGGIERVRTRLTQLAAAGPAARLGLRVTPTSSKWAYDPARVCDDVVSAPATTGIDLEDRLTELSASSSADVPIRARLAGDYLLLDLSHGFSDAVLPIELYAYLADPAADPPLPPWATDRIVGNPLPRALAGWILHNPRKVVDIVYGKLAPGGSAEAGIADDVVTHHVPWTRSPAVATSTSPAGVPAELRAWRTQQLPDVSVTSILCASIATALSTRGTPVSDSAGFLFDCRRYLRARGTVLGNFAVGIDFEHLDPTAPTDLHTALTHAIDKGRPLASGTFSALRYLRTRRPLPAVASDTAPVSPDARLTFSDIGRVRRLESIAWLAEPEKRSFFALSEPAAPDSIVITTKQIDDAFHVSASFHDNVFDPRAVQAALDLAMSDPVGLLGAQEPPR